MQNENFLNKIIWHRQEFLSTPDYLSADVTPYYMYAATLRYPRSEEATSQSELLKLT